MLTNNASRFETTNKILNIIFCKFKMIDLIFVFAPLIIIAWNNKFEL